VRETCWAGTTRGSRKRGRGAKRAQLHDLHRTGRPVCLPRHLPDRRSSQEPKLEDLAVVAGKGGQGPLQQVGGFGRRPAPIDLIRRLGDRRGVLVELADQGRWGLDEAVKANTEAERELIAGLEPAEARELSARLRKMLTGLEA
jgi:hypothetical protein